ncbi:TPA: hypothetical protein ACGL72_002149 [Streptococcus agalactiae]
MISRLKKITAVSCMALMLLANAGSVFAAEANPNNVDILSKYSVE